MKRSEKVRKAGWAIVAGGALAWLSVPAGAQTSPQAQGGANAVFAQSGQSAENQLVPMTQGGEAVADSQQEGINVVEPGEPSGKDLACGGSEDGGAQGQLSRGPVAARTANPRAGGPAKGSDHSKIFQLKMGGQMLTLTSRWKGGASVCDAKLGIKGGAGEAQAQSGMPNLLYEVPRGGAILAPNHRGGALVIVIIKAGSGPVATVTIDSAGHAQLQPNAEASANAANPASSGR